MLLNDAASASEERCKKYRLRILELSKNVPALHIAPAYSCIEILDYIYFELLRPLEQDSHDKFVLSKGHGAIAWYCVLEALGILSTQELELYCKPEGGLGAHPDRGLPGIIASTGSLGHGLGLATGVAYSQKLKGAGRTFVLVSDGELQEGSSWEAAMMAANLGLSNLSVFVDLNDFGGMDRMTIQHPAFYPLADKFVSFGFEVVEADGHKFLTLHEAVNQLTSKKPKVIICNTVKGKGVSFMENVPIWHYRSPSEEEYQIAVKEIG